jgi:hypothetical protein
MHVIVCAKKSNVIVANNKSKGSKQHHILLFLQGPPNMSFLTTILLPARSHFHVRCIKKSYFKILFAIFAKKKLSGSI